MKVPKNLTELQTAVDAAAGARLLADCMMYGLITGPAINVERCDELLEAGQARGIYPSKRVGDLAFDLFMQNNAEREQKAS